MIDVPKVTGGSVLRLLLNADEDHAVAILSPPGQGARTRVSRS